MFYVAGRCWLHGESPYNAQAWERNFREAAARWPEVRTRTWYGVTSAFAYPPVLAVLVAPWSLLPYPLAEKALLLLNGAAWLVTCFALATFACDRKNPWKYPELWLFAGLAGFATQSVPQSLWFGNFGPLVFAAGVTALYAWRRRRLTLLAVAVIFAAVKPQGTAIILAYLFFAGGATPVTVGAFFAVMLSLLVLWLSPGTFSEALGEFRDTFHQYRTHEAFTTAAGGSAHYDSLSNYWGLPGLLGDTRMGSAAMVAGVLFGIALAAIMAIRTKVAKVDPESVEKREPVMDVPVLMALSAAFLPLHPYDYFCYAAIVCLVPTFWGSKLKWPLLIAVCLAGRAANIKGLLLAAHLTTNSLHLKFLPHLLSGVVLALTILIAWMPFFNGTSVNDGSRDET
jgi:hypothetical protein